MRNILVLTVAVLVVMLGCKSESVRLSDRLPVPFEEVPEVVVKQFNADYPNAVPTGAYKQRMRVRYRYNLTWYEFTFILRADEEHRERYLTDGANVIPHYEE